MNLSVTNVMAKVTLPEIVPVVVEEEEKEQDQEAEIVTIAVRMGTFQGIVHLIEEEVEEVVVVVEGLEIQNATNVVRADILPESAQKRMEINAMVAVKQGI